MATKLTEKNTHLLRLSRITALCEELENVDPDEYEDLHELREKDPSTYARLAGEMISLGHLPDDTNSAYGNACDIRTELQKAYVGIEKKVTLQIAPHVEIIFTASETDRVYAAVLDDWSDLMNRTETPLTPTEIEAVIAAYELDLTY